MDRVIARTLREVRACTVCGEHLEPRPFVQLSGNARILIAGQAPGRKVHEGGTLFADASGNRLRDWLGIDDATFYDPDLVAILPMGFCYPGKGRSGDLPPRPECAETWRDRLMALLPRVGLTVILGKYALAWHAGERGPLNEVVGQWEQRLPDVVVLPHPSPRNNPWLSAHPWFEAEVVPRVRARVAELLG